MRSLGIAPAAHPGLRRRASLLASDLGLQAVPTLVRLAGRDGSWVSPAGDLLVEIARDPVARDRAIAALDEARPATEDLRRALVQLRDRVAAAGAPPSETRDPVGDLVRLLEDAPDYARLASELCELTDEGECLRFVADVAESAPASGRDLARELLARDEISDHARQELRRIASSVPPSCPVSYGTRRTAVRLGRSRCGRQVLIVTRKRSERRWRVLFVVIDASGTVSAAEYSDEATRHTIDKNIIGATTTAGFELEKVSRAEGRELLLAAIRATRRAGIDIPTAYFVGRDLLSITDEHRRSDITGAEDAALLSSALEALSSGRHRDAFELFERYTLAAPHDPEGFEGLGLCQLRLGNLPAARVALGRAAFLSPEEPRYHWNRAAAARSAGLRGACYLALRDYLRVAEGRDGPDRIEAARSLVADFERKAALHYPELSARSAACQADLASVER